MSSKSINESTMKRRMKALSIAQRRKYGIPTSDIGIDILTGAVLMSLFSNVAESHDDAPESFSGAGASDSWDDNSSSSSSDSSYSSDSSSSSCGGD